jgi:hypothetical protein
MKPTKGKVYRTQEFAKYDTNPTRLATSLVKKGLLKRLRSGLFYAPKFGVFGEVPPSEAALLKGYFAGKPYLRSGPSVWNALGLGTTAVESVPLVYNTTKTGIETLGDKQFEFRRVRFPRKVDREYLVVDLFENLARAGADLESVQRALTLALRQGQFDVQRLQERAKDYGSRATRKAILAAQVAEP